MATSNHPLTNAQDGHGDLDENPQGNTRVPPTLSGRRRRRRRRSVARKDVGHDDLNRVKGVEPERATIL